MAQGEYLTVSTGQLITSSINTFTISSGTLYARTLSTVNVYADYVKGDGYQLSNVPFTPAAYSIPWNAMQPYGGLVIQSGDWYLQNVTASNIVTNSLTTVQGKIASLTSRVICTFFLSTNSMKAIYNDFDVQTGGVQIVQSSIMGYLSTGRLDVGFTNINQITSKYGQFSTISTGVWNAGNIQFSSLSLFDNALQINNVITMSSGILLLNNNDYLSNTVAISNLVSTTTNLRFSLLFTSNVLATKEADDFNSTKIALSTLSTVSGSNLSTTNTTIFSSLTGLGSLGYVSTTSLTSSLTGLGSIGYVSTSQHTSTVAGLGNVGYVSTTSLTSSLTGLGSIGYVSTSQHTSTVAGLGNVGYVSTASLTSSLTGLGSIGYVSTSQHTSTVAGLGSLGYVSTASLTSSLTGLGSIGYVSSTQIQSSLTGLGSLGYVSTTSLTTTLTSSLTGLGSLGYVSTTSLTTSLTSSLTGLGSLGYVSSTQLQSSLTGLGSLGYVSTSQHTSTVAGLGSLGYVSSTQLQSSLTGLGSIGYVSTTSLTTSLTGLGSIGYISSTQNTSTVAGLGSLGYVSSTQLQSSLEGLGSLGYISTPGVNSSYINSTLTGLGSLGYISTPGVNSSYITSTVTGLGSLGYISTPGVNSSYITSTVTGLGSLGYVSSTQLQSSLEGLGSLGYISTPGVNSSYITSTVTGLGSLGYISTPGVNSNYINSTVTGLGSLGYVSSTQLQSSLEGLGSLGYISTPGVNSSYITSTVTGLGSLGYISTLGVNSNYINSTVTGLGSLGYVSSTQLQSSLEGLGSLGYISTPGVNSNYINSTVTGLGSLGYISTLSVTPSSLTGLGSLGYVSSTQLQSSLEGLGSLGYISTGTNANYINSTVTGLGSLGYVSTSQLQSTITGLGSLGYISTPGVNSSYINSTVTGLGSLGYISTLGVNSNYINSTVTGLGSLAYVSSTQLQSSLEGLGSLGYISTPGVNSNYINSTVTGLGSLGYVSSTQLQSSLEGLGSLGFISTPGVNSSYITSTVTGLGSLNYVSTTLNATRISSLTVSTLALSTFTLFTQGSNSLVITNSNAGNFIVSSMNLGINTTQPQYPLDVNGVANFSSISLGAGNISLLARFNSLAIGYQVGTYGLGSNTLALGYQAGFSNQGESATAIGMTAGSYSQSQYAIAIGNSAGYSNQGSNAIAIGNSAGYLNQSTNSIAIGWLAGQTTTATSSIILNASGIALNTRTPGLFVKPVRYIPGGNIVHFNTTTSELAYSDTTQLTSLTAVNGSFTETLSSGSPLFFVSTLAGSATSGSTNGTGSAASFNQPTGCCFDTSGNMFVVDSGLSIIRKIVISTGVVTTLAGTPSSYGSNDGIGPAAQFYFPQGMCYDGNGNLFVVDVVNQKIRKIVIATSNVTSFAGSGAIGGNNAVGTLATFNFPQYIAYDGIENLFVTDNNNRIVRKIVLATSNVTTFAGGAVGSADGVGTAASFNWIHGICSDSTGANLYVSDVSNNNIRRINTATSNVTTIAGAITAGSNDGIGTAARFTSPYDVTADSAGNLFVADSGNHKIRKIVLSTSNVTTLAGTGSTIFADGMGSVATFNNPQGIIANSIGQIFVTDKNNNRIRLLSPLQPLVVSSNITMNSAVNMVGRVGIGGSANSSNALLVTGTQSNTGNLFIGGTTTLVASSNTGTLGVAGLATFVNSSNTGTLGVAGLTTLATLDVNGTTNLNAAVRFKTALFHTSDDGKQRFYFESNSTTYFKSGNGTFKFENSGSATTLLNIDNSGNVTASGKVAIGTTIANAQLHIFGGEQTLGGGTLSNLIAFESQSGGYKHFITSRHSLTLSGSAIDFWLNNTTQAGSTTAGTGNVNTMSVTAVGIGINCNAPAYALDVNGSANVNTTLRVVGLATFVNTSNTGTLGVAGLATFVNSSNTGTLGVAGTLGVTGLATFVNSSNTGTLGVAGLATFVNSSNTGTLGVAGLATFVNSSNTGTLGVAGLATLATLDVNGTTNLNAAVRFKTGVFHTSDDGKQRLYFDSNSTTYIKSGNGTFKFENSGSATTLLNIDNSGNVTASGNVNTSGNVTATGIIKAEANMIIGTGITTPNAKLHIRGGGDVGAPSSSSYQNLFGFESQSAGYTHFITSTHALGSSSLNAINFWLNNTTQGGSTTAGTGNVNIMSITGVGLGINCNAPGYMLDVNGTTNLNGAVRFKTNVSHIGDDGIAKVFYASNSATYYLATSHIFQTPNSVNTFTIDSLGNTSNIGTLGVAGAATFSSNLSVARRFTNGRFEIFPVTANNYTIMTLSGGNTQGYIFADFQLLGDGIHMGYNYYGSNGVAYSGNGFGNGCSLISMGYATISLKTGSTSNLNTALYVGTSGRIGINTVTPSYTLDVNGPMQAAMYYSSITVGGTTTVTPDNFGIYYNIMTSGTYTIAFSATQASSNIGKYFSFRNNSGSTLSLTLTGVSGITSPLSLGNAQTAIFVVATTTTYALF